MVPEKKDACTAADRLADRVHIHSKDPIVWTLIPIRGQADTFNIVVKDRKPGCLRFLAAPSDCADNYVRLAVGDNGSGAQRWIIKLVNPPKPPAKRPPPPAKLVEVPVVNYSIAITGYTKDTFGAAQSAAFCASVVNATNYPSNLLRCVVAFVTDQPFNQTNVGRRLHTTTVYVRGYTAFTVYSSNSSSLAAAQTAANGLYGTLSNPNTCAAVFQAAYPNSTASPDKVDLGKVPEPLTPLPPPTPPSPSPLPSPSPTPSPSPSPSPSPQPSPPPSIPVLSPSPVASPSPSPPPPASGVPDAPLSVVATASKYDGSKATVKWAPPLSDGGAAILGYSVTCTSTPGGVKVGPKTYLGAATTTTGVDGFSGLTPLTSYKCAVVAFNTNGPSQAAESNEITTAGAPILVSASTEVGAKATVQWTAPPDTTDIVNYEVVCTSSGGVAVTHVYDASTARTTSPCTTGVNGFAGKSFLRMVQD